MKARYTLKELKKMNSFRLRALYIRIYQFNPWYFSVYQSKLIVQICNILNKRDAYI